MSLWIKDECGRSSVMVTLLLVSFVVTTVVYCLSEVSRLGNLQIRPFDVGAASTYFGAILAAYVSHRWVDNKYGAPPVPPDAPPPPPPPPPPVDQSVTVTKVTTTTETAQ